MRLRIITVALAALVAVGCIGKKIPYSELEPRRPRDYNFEQRYTEVEGVRISYIDEGPRDAPVLLFVHGLGGALDNWTYNIPYFREKYRCLAIDMPGFGNSEQDDDFSYTLKWYTDILKAFIEKMEVEKATLIGNSMGGHTVAYTAIRHPEIVERLVLVDASGTFGPKGLQTKILVRFPNLAEKIVLRTAGKHLAKGPDHFVEWIDKTNISNPEGAGIYKFDTPQEKEFRERMLELAGWFGYTEAYPKYMRAILGVGRSILTTPLNDRLDEIKCPTLIWWGKEDRVVPLEEGDKYLKGIDDAKMVVVEEVGHVGMIERPELFNDTVDRFIRMTSGDDEDPNAGTRGK